MRGRVSLCEPSGHSCMQPAERGYVRSSTHLCWETELTGSKHTGSLSMAYCCSTSLELKVEIIYVAVPLASLCAYFHDSEKFGLAQMDERKIITQAVFLAALYVELWVYIRCPCAETEPRVVLIWMVLRYQHKKLSCALHSSVTVYWEG